MDFDSFLNPDLHIPTIHYAYALTNGTGKIGKPCKFTKEEFHRAFPHVLIYIGYLPKVLLEGSGVRLINYPAPRPLFNPPWRA